MSGYNKGRSMTTHLQQLDASYPEWRSIEIGRQVKCKHVGHCDNGTDHRERMYVLRKTHNTWLAYCHNCSYTGYYVDDDKYSLLVPLPEYEETLSATRTLLIGGDVTNDRAKWPLEAKLFLDRYELEDTLCAPFIRWCQSAPPVPPDDVGRLYLPMFHWNTNNFSNIIGYQLRDVAAKRFKTRFIKPQYDAGSLLIVNPDCDSVVIVEDLLSHYKLADCGYNSFALCGTHLNQSWVDAIAMFKEIVIWLDPDTAGSSGTLKLYKQLTGELLGGEHNIISVFGLEPKHKTLEQIKDMLNV